MYKTPPRRGGNQKGKCNVSALWIRSRSFPRVFSFSCERAEECDGLQCVLTCVRTCACICDPYVRHRHVSAARTRYIECHASDSLLNSVSTFFEEDQMREFDCNNFRGFSSRNNFNSELRKRHQNLIKDIFEKSSKFYTSLLYVP